MRIHRWTLIVMTLATTLATSLAGCGGSESVSRPRSMNTDPIRVAFAANSVDPNAPVLLMATAIQATRLSVCAEISPDSCVGTNAAFRSATRMNLPDRADTAFFRTTEPIALANVPAAGLILILNALDDAGGVVATTRVRVHASAEIAGATDNPAVAALRWLNVNDYGNVAPAGSAHYVDVVGHTNPNDSTNPRGNGMGFKDAPTRAHETAHMLHAQLSDLAGGTGWQGMYFESGKALAFREPEGVKVTAFEALVPTRFKGDSTHATYMRDGPRQFPSKDRMGHIFNEWAAYCVNGRVSLEIIAGGGQLSEEGAHNAPKFFAYAATGIKYMMDNNSPGLKDPQFLGAFALYADYTFRLMNQSLPLPRYASAARSYLDYFRSDTEFEPYRQAITAVYRGAYGSAGERWVARLLSK